MICKGCNKSVAWHWTGVCGACAGDFNPANTTRPSNPAAKVAAQLAHEASKQQARDAARERRSIREADLFVPFSEEGKERMARAAAERAALPRDPFGNVLDGGEMD